MEASADAFDTVYSHGPIITGCCRGRTDVLVRVQRDVANRQYTFEVCDTPTGGNCQSAVAAITGFGTPSWAGATIHPSPGEDAAFARWFSSVVPVGTQIPILATGDLGDWEFEGNLNDSSGHGLAMSGGAFGYVPTLAYPPLCNAGKQQSFRAGHPGTLDGTGSSPLDGGAALTFLWQQSSGAKVTWDRSLVPRPVIGRAGVTHLTISGQNTPQPVISGFAPGSYTFRLTVTDGSGQSTACTVNDGAVETDDNGVVITNNPAVDTLLGPMIRYGASPWPWFDDRQKADADVQIANMDTYYGAYWDVADPGTVTVKIGSPTVTGVGTTFTTTFCKGPGDPHTPKSNALGIIIWYPTGVLGQTGRRVRFYLTSCQSDTELTMGGIWFPNDIPDGSGLSYSDTSNYGTWAYGSAPANYYDNVAAFYALYYRSGIVDYLNAARKLADRFWECPQVDRGNSYVGNGAGGGWPSRSQSAMGVVLRALDGRSDMWPGLRKWWDFYGRYYLGPGSYDAGWLPDLWDQREVAYELLLLSYCALDDPDPAHRATCQGWVNGALPLFTLSRKADGSWAGLAANSYSWTTPPTTVTLTQGSRAVVGTGTSWTASQFTLNSQGMPAAIWFLPSSSRPASNKDGDPTSYTAEFVDSTHLTLDRPYQGSTGTHGWALSSASSDIPFVGIGSYVYTMGMLGAAFDLASKSIAETYPGGSGLYRSYNIDAANWIKAYGYRAATKSIYYGVQYVNCQAPIPEGNNPCTAAMAADGARVLNAEAIRGLMTAYAYNKDEGLRSLTDVLFNGMWAKPGTCPVNSILCVSDGVYVDAFDDGQWYLAGTPPTGAAPKYFGQMWGFSELSSWPAIRLGGPQPAAGQVFYLNWNRTAVPGAVAVRVITTAPDGTDVSTQCASSPCAITVYRLGDRPAKLEYLSGSGAVLAGTQLQLM